MVEVDVGPLLHIEESLGREPDKRAKVREKKKNKLINTKLQ